MSMICEIVQQIIKAGYLTVKAEEQLRQLLAIGYDLEDIDALTRLQRAATSGIVKQESRELKRHLNSAPTEAKSRFYDAN